MSMKYPLVVHDSLTLGSRFTIGSSATISVWLDRWIPGNPTYNPNPLHGSQIEPGMKVRDLMMIHPKRWNIQLIESLLDTATTTKIRRIHLKEQDRSRP